MGQNKNILPLEIEINTLRQKLKASNNETVEECERLRSEIQKLYFQIARITRPGRHAEKQSKVKKQQSKNYTITPEVIPPDLDVNEYLNSLRETAAAKDVGCQEDFSKQDLVNENSREKQTDSNSNLLPATIENVNASRPCLVNTTAAFKSKPQTLYERDKTIEERFAVIAERMQERRRLWLENKDKKRPWWKRV